MSPATLALIMALVEEAVKVTPGLIVDIQALFANGEPTPADWQAFHDKVKANSYADYVPASALPALEATALAAAVAETVQPSRANFAAVVDVIKPAPDAAALAQPPKVVLVADAPTAPDARALASAEPPAPVTPPPAPGALASADNPPPADATPATPEWVAPDQRPGYCD